MTQTLHPLLQTFTPVSEIMAAGPKYTEREIKKAVKKAERERFGWRVVGGFFLPVLLACFLGFGAIDLIFLFIGKFLHFSIPDFQDEITSALLVPLGSYLGYAAPAAIYYGYAKPIASRLAQRRDDTIEFDKVLNENLMRAERILQSYPGKAAEIIIDRITKFYLLRAGARQTENVKDEAFGKVARKALGDHPLVGPRAAEDTDEIIKLLDNAAAAGDAGVSLLKKKPTEEEHSMARFLAKVSIIVLALIPSGNIFVLVMKAIVGTLVIMHVLNLREMEDLIMHGKPIALDGNQAQLKKLIHGSVYWLTHGYRTCPGIDLFAIMKDEGKIFLIVGDRKTGENKYIRIDSLDELRWTICHFD